MYDLSLRCYSCLAIQYVPPLSFHLTSSFRTNLICWEKLLPLNALPVIPASNPTPFYVSGSHTAPIVPSRYFSPHIVKRSCSLIPQYLIAIRNRVDQFRMSHNTSLYVPHLLVCCSVLNLHTPLVHYHGTPHVSSCAGADYRLEVPAQTVTVLS